MPTRELAFRAIAVLLGVAIPLALVEASGALALAWHRHRYDAQMPDAVRAAINLADRGIETLPDPYLGYRMKPGVQRERVQTNALGLRNGPVAERPEPGTLRVLFLGGSVTWGFTSNSNDDTVPAYLAAELAARPELRGRRIEVLNAGVPGYVSWQSALLYALELRRLEPSWVVSLDAANDISSAIINGRAGVPKRYRLSERSYLALRPSIAGALQAGLLSAARELNAVKAVERWWPPPLESFAPPPPREVGAALRDAMAFLADVAGHAGARPLSVLQPMVMLPDTKPLSNFERAIVREFEVRMPGRNRYHVESHAAMREALAELDRARTDAFGWLDASDAFDGVSEVTFTDECHLTPLGRRLLARRIAEALVRPARPTETRTDRPAG